MTLQSFIYTCFYGQDLLHTFYDHILHILVYSDTWYMCNPESFYMKKRYFVSFFIAKKSKPAKLCSRFRYQTCDTGKSVSEALILKSVNPQYDDRLFIELQVQYKKIASSEHVKNILSTKIVLNVKTRTKNNFCTQHVLDMSLTFSELAIFLC